MLFLGISTHYKHPPEPAGPLDRIFRGEDVPGEEKVQQKMGKNLLMWAFIPSFLLTFLQY